MKKHWLQLLLLTLNDRQVEVSYTILFCNHFEISIIKSLKRKQIEPNLKKKLKVYQNITNVLLQCYSLNNNHKQEIIHNTV